MSFFRKRSGIVIAVAAVLLAVGLGAAGLSRSAGRPKASEASFVGRESCLRCHKEQHEKWRGSHHDLAMQKPTEENVLGDFSGVEFSADGTTNRFFRKGGDFYVRTRGPDGEPGEYKIEYTFGVEPLQQYLVELPKGRMQALTVAWDTKKGRWFSLHPDQQVEPGDALHWTGRLQNWNYMCASCHSTNLQKNYDPETDTFETTWSELDVSCEACHGPGSEHVDWAESSWAGKLLSGEHYGLTADLHGNYPDGAPAKQTAVEPADEQINACFSCHARREEVMPGYTHTEPFMNHYRPELLREGLYHADGQINDEVYVYGSYTQSKMYHQGVSCADCHDPHTAELKATGNALCLRCHGASYNRREHHFHEPGTAGASCVECHMPDKKYMVIDPRRDHSLRVPRPDLSVDLGVPNACNRCHTDKSAEWAAQAVVEHHGPERPNEPHFARTIAAGRAGKDEALPKLADLAGNEEKPDIVRATALHLLGRYADPAAREALTEGAAAGDPLLRATAARRLDRLSPDRRVKVVAPLLDDPMRAVRVEAARVLSGVPADQFDGRQKQALREVIKEYERGQLALAAQPGARLNLAVLYENRGRTQKAIAQYRRAIEMDPAFVPARINLAHVLNRRGDNEAAERQFREVIELRPDFGEAHYSLGLLLAEMKRLREAANHLKRATELMPDHARAHYNYGLALQRMNRRDRALTPLMRAHQLEPEAPDFLHALAILHVQRGELSEAYKYAEKLVQQAPDRRGPRRLLQRIRSRMLQQR